MNVETKLAKLICPECGKRGYKTPQLLGRHRQREHGYVSPTRHYAIAQRAREESQPETSIIVQPAQETPASDAPKRRPSHRDSQTQIPDEIIAYTVGKLEAVVEGIANQNDIPARQFARKCAEYFSSAANR